jgi:hypothetical protein
VLAAWRTRGYIYTEHVYDQFDSALTTTALVKEENMFKSFSLESTTRDLDRKCNTEKA